MCGGCAQASAGGGGGFGATPMNQQQGLACDPFVNTTCDPCQCGSTTLFQSNTLPINLDVQMCDIRKDIERCRREYKKCIWKVICNKVLGEDECEGGGKDSKGSKSKSPGKSNKSNSDGAEEEEEGGEENDNNARRTRRVFRAKNNNSRKTRNNKYNRKDSSHNNAAAHKHYYNDTASFDSRPRYYRPSNYRKHEGRRRSSVPQRYRRSMDSYSYDYVSSDRTSDGYYRGNYEQYKKPYVSRNSVPRKYKHRGSSDYSNSKILICPWNTHSHSRH